MYYFGFYFLLELNLMQFAINECGCDLAVHDCVLLVFLAMASLQLWEKTIKELVFCFYFWKFWELFLWRMVWESDISVRLR